MERGARTRASAAARPRCDLARPAGETRSRGSSRSLAGTCPALHRVVHPRSPRSSAATARTVRSNESRPLRAPRVFRGKRSPSRATRTRLSAASSEYPSRSKQYEYSDEQACSRYSRRRSISMRCTMTRTIACRSVRTSSGMQARRSGSESLETDCRCMSFAYHEVFWARRWPGERLARGETRRKSFWRQKRARAHGGGAAKRARSTLSGCEVDSGRKASTRIVRAVQIVLPRLSPCRSQLLET